MAHPKRKISKTRRDKRRTHHALTPAAVMECPGCNTPVQYHRVCGKCGQYRHKQAVQKETAV